MLVALPSQIFLLCKVTSRPGSWLIRIRSCPGWNIARAAVCFVKIMLLRKQELPAIQRTPSVGGAIYTQPSSSFPGHLRCKISVCRTL